MIRRRVVLDTNVLVSALLFGQGRLSWIRRAWHGGGLVPLLSKPTAEELLRVLGYPKFRLTGDERDHLLADLLPWCETVAMESPLAGVPACRDEHDRKFLELALAGRAEAVVTGDADLLALAGGFAIRILDPAAFRALMSAKD